MHVQLSTPCEFVEIAKDARKRPFAAHLWFSDIHDNFTVQILLWGFVVVFFHLRGVKQLFFYKCNYLGGGGRNLEEKNVEKGNFPIALKQ